jgi:hypothetical protein
MFERFLDLGDDDAPDYEIASYAAQFGVLGLCEHGHVSTYCTSLAGHDGEPAVDNPTDIEPLDTWRRWARAARTTVDVAFAARQKPPKEITDTQLHQLVDYSGNWLFERSDFPSQHAAARSLVANVCNRWLTEGDARLILDWPPRQTRPELTIGAPVADAGVFCALGIQLSLACARSDGVAVCDGCGSLHSPSRQPRPGQRTFCARCRADKIPVKLANRDRRARERQEGSSP